MSLVNVARKTGQTAGRTIWTDKQKRGNRWGRSRRMVRKGRGRVRKRENREDRRGEGGCSDVFWWFCCNVSSQLFNAWFDWTHTHTRTHVQTHMRSSLCVPTVPPVVRLQLLVMWFRSSVVGNKDGGAALEQWWRHLKINSTALKTTVTKLNNVVARFKIANRFVSFLTFNFIGKCLSFNTS